MAGPYHSSPSVWDTKKTLTATTSFSPKPPSSVDKPSAYKKPMTMIKDQWSKMASTSPKLLAKYTPNNVTSSSKSSVVQTPTSPQIARKNHRFFSSSSSVETNEKELDIINAPEEDKSPSLGEETNETAELDKCAICMDDCVEPKKLSKCDHTFCTECIDQYFRTVKPQCPCCFTIYGEIRGNQPEDGRMTSITYKKYLPGYEKNSSGSIKITYTFPSGTQNDNHPNPGMPYHGTTRDAYLPDNPEGRHVHQLLRKAFDLRQVFTVGQSRTTGQDNVVTWNDIHHKTSPTGGIENFAYPDKTYLNRVQQELAAKGIV